jgi:hypothetical protein
MRKYEEIIKAHKDAIEYLAHYGLEFGKKRA